MACPVAFAELATTFKLSEAVRYYWWKESPARLGPGPGALVVCKLERRPRLFAWPAARPLLRWLVGVWLGPVGLAGYVLTDLWGGCMSGFAFCSAYVPSARRPAARVCHGRSCGSCMCSAVVGGRLMVGPPAASSASSGRRLAACDSGLAVAAVLAGGAHGGPVMVARRGSMKAGVRARSSWMARSCFRYQQAARVGFGRPVFLRGAGLCRVRAWDGGPRVSV